MKISNRLYKIYEEVATGETVADVGTDHGFVPILLIKNNISPAIIMSDISSKSLDKAINNLKDIKTSTLTSFRVSDGLIEISYGEVDDIIIAGMGGQLIIDILEKDIDKTHSFKKLILQPRNNSGRLRHWLYKNNFNIEKNVLAKEGKFVCEIIVAKTDFNINKIYENIDKDSIKWEFPKSFKYSEKELLNEKINWKIESINNEINNLKKSKDDKTYLIKKLEIDLEYLKTLLI